MGSSFQTPMTYYKIGWAGNYIETDPELITKLHSNLKGLNYKCIQGQVSCETGHKLDDFLGKMDVAEIDIFVP